MTNNKKILHDLQAIITDRSPYHKLTLELVSSYKSFVTEKDWDRDYYRNRYLELYSKFHNFIYNAHKSEKKVAIKTAALKKKSVIGRLGKKIILLGKANHLISQLNTVPNRHYKYAEVSLNMGEADSIRQLFKKLVSTDSDVCSARIELALALMQYTMPDFPLHSETVKFYFHSFLTETSKWIPEQENNIVEMLPQITVTDDEKKPDHNNSE